MRKKITFHIITLFPRSISGYFESSILKRAAEDGKIEIKFYDIKDFLPKGERADRKPFGGGPGMVIKAEPVVKAAEKAVGKKKAKIIIFSPSGRLFDGKYARALSKSFRDIVLVAGHYEGVDQRAKKILKAEEVSIGPYVLTGGELPAAVLVDSVARHVPGVLGNVGSIEESRVSSPEVYTRPEEIKHKGKIYRAPKVLLSGHHKKIEEWKKNKRKLR